MTEAAAHIRRRKSVDAVLARELLDTGALGLPSRGHTGLQSCASVAAIGKKRFQRKDRKSDAWRPLTCEDVDKVFYRCEARTTIVRVLTTSLMITSCPLSASCTTLGGTSTGYPSATCRASIGWGATTACSIEFFRSRSDITTHANPTPKSVRGDGCHRYAARARQSRRDTVSRR